VIVAIAGVGKLLAGILVLAVLVALLVAANRRRRLRSAFAAVTVVLVSTWVLAWLAVRADYRDADGFIDCWPSCSVLQDSVGGTLFLAPLLWITLGVVAAVLAASRD
jgi:hypothetical protein